MPYLFCNIGWMDAYKGTARIVGGGAYVDENKEGFEMCNFLPYRGKVYGYVSPPGGGQQIKIERLGAGREDLSVSNITVIWTAKRPQEGTVVVGWYKDATVHRESQEFRSSFPHKKKHHIEDYRIETLENNAKLLPIEQRTLEVPRGKGGMGQSNVWYADKPNHEGFLEKVEWLIQGKKRRAKRKQPHKTDPEKNAQVEKAATNTTTRHFENISTEIHLETAMSYQVAKSLKKHGKDLGSWAKSAKRKRTFTLQRANCFLVGVLFDQQVNAEQAWDAAEWITESIGEQGDDFWKAICEIDVRDRRCKANRLHAIWMGWLCVSPISEEDGWFLERMRKSYRGGIRRRPQKNMEGQKKYFQSAGTTRETSGNWSGIITHGRSDSCSELRVTRR